VLTNDEVEEFVELGYVRIGEAFPSAVARECCDLAFDEHEPFGHNGVLGSTVPLPDLSESVAYATGTAGDVYLCHPFLVHAASWPHTGPSPRVIAVPPIALDGALRLDAPPHQLSPVARAISESLHL